MYKLTRPDGYDFYSGTINYRDAIGSVVRVTDYDPPDAGACGHGLHACEKPNDCFVGARIPCAAFRVSGIQKIAEDTKKTRWQALKVIEEIHDLDKLFGWTYSEVVNPIHPFTVSPPIIGAKHIELLKQWDSVWASVGASVGASVWASVGASVRASVGASVWDSVWASVWAYIGSLFPNISNWKHTDHTTGEYPFQPAVDLWRLGLVPSFDGNLWRLHGGKNAEVLWEGKI